MRTSDGRQGHAHTVIFLYKSGSEHTDRGAQLAAVTRVSVRRFAATAAAVGQARRYARQVTRAWGLAGIAKPIELVVSELITNAIKASSGVAVHRESAENARTREDSHLEGASDGSADVDEAAGLTALRITVTGLNLLIEVWDESDLPPVLQEPSLDAEGGRGLLLVAAIAKQWGCYRRPQQAK